MRRTIAALAILLFVACAGNSQKASQQDQKATAENTVASADVLAWDYVIDDGKVAGLSAGIAISDIKDFLPADFKLVRDSIQEPNLGDTEEESFSSCYKIFEKEEQVMRIWPNSEEDSRIFSIEVLSSKYKVEGSDIGVGSTVEQIESVFTILKDYLNFDDGLFLFCQEKKIAFEIDLEGRTDEYFSNGEAPANCKVRAIVVYNDAYYEEMLSAF